MHTLKYTDDYLEYIYTYEIKGYHRGPDYAHVKVYWWLPRIYLYLGTVSRSGTWPLDYGATGPVPDP